MKKKEEDKMFAKVNFWGVITDTSNADKIASEPTLSCKLNPEIDISEFKGSKKLQDTPEINEFNRKFIKRNLSLKMCVTLLQEWFEINDGEALSMLQSNDELLTPRFNYEAMMEYKKHNK